MSGALKSTGRPVVVVGAGAAGLACAADLIASGVATKVLEASNAAGGRMRTDIVDGFVVDRGFQVFNTAYPQIKRRLNLRDLSLRPFTPGVQVHTDARRVRLYDPLRRPAAVGGFVEGGLVSARDALALGAMSARDMLLPAALIKQGSHRTTRAALRGAGISDSLIEQVLRPFLAGVFLDDQLETDSRVFHLVWRSMLRGTLCLPADGIEAVPRAMVRALPSGALQTDTAVAELTDEGVITAAGAVIPAAAVVVAAGPETTAALLPNTPVPAYRTVTTYYHCAGRAPLDEPALVVDAHGRLLNTCVLTQVSKTFSADSRSLIATSVLGVDEPGRQAQVRHVLSEMYGTDTDPWQLVAARTVTHALPVMTPPHSLSTSSRVGPGRYVCGDLRATGSVQGAMASGARAAREVIHDLTRHR
ncbi:FAD-dependent oxidoreductase [Streptomyces sp. HUAS MG91]|uniref:FAD-dependent oxidoreductase n=1 Tax=Streptomyces tabacisoli TaxID=3156398 RepID=A0AAU8J5K7_9ACTN